MKSMQELCHEDRMDSETLELKGGTSVKVRKSLSPEGFGLTNGNLALRPRTLLESRVHSDAMLAG